VRRALEAWAPDVVLVEGPPEADPLLPLAADEGMQPPVALLVHAADDPGRAAFWPFASFSPEWQAIRHGLDRGVPVRFVDLPAAHVLAGAVPRRRARDPLADLAAAAGYDDPERWWEDVVELGPAGHPSAVGPFEAVAEAMAGLREAGDGAGGPDRRGGPDPDARREAAMRLAVRAAEREGFERVAVVCGAWHVPAVTAPTTRAADRALLRGLPRTKVVATWVPWTHGRLALASGYGAGVEAPGWYDHLHTAPDQPVARWLVRVARLLRDEDLDVPPASVIEAVRLAETLATLRGRPLAGLSEVDDAARAVLGQGAEAPMALIRRRLVVGDVLGRVPEHTPMVPLARDVAAHQRRLRLRPEAGVRRLDLDLRRPVDLARSHLLHRLAILGVPWGVPAEPAAGHTGTFRESWRLEWQPELAVRLVEAGMWGTTVAAAAAARALERAEGADRLQPLTELVEGCLLADLPDTVARVMAVLADRAALAADVGQLADALPPLARVLRYGNVRGTDAGAVGAVVEGLVARVCVGAPAAWSSLDDEAAAEALARLGAVQGAVALLDRPDLADRWAATVRRLLDQPGLHGLLAGRCCRLLVDGGRLGRGDVAPRLAAVLSVGEEPGRAAAWIEGFLAGSGLLLLHDPALFRLVDGWLAAIPAERFPAVLPLLRRTFATFPPAERRQLGERAREAAAAPATGGATGGDDGGDGEDLDATRAEPVLATVARLLGVEAGP
jgi:hypothetical protein